MTKKDVLEAAFKVWGREFYANTSLNYVAHELKVCKQALYRYYINKNALLEAMTRHFFDDFSSFIQADFDRAIKIDNKNESIFILIRSVAEYFARNVHYFIFSMVQLNNQRFDTFNIMEELCVRGVDFKFFHQSVNKEHSYNPLVLRLVFTTLTFYMAGFHMRENSLKNPPDDTKISCVIENIGKIIGGGLGYVNEEINTLDYDNLENRIAGTINNIDDDPLLKAVAGAVADAGPWGASMEQVARRSGLSKSSLYCHFKSRQDMLHQLFMTESMRIINFARQGIGQSAVPQEQLYLGIFSIAEYLRSKPDILVALDWIRNRKLNFPPADKKMHAPAIESLRLFDEIDIGYLQNDGSPFRLSSNISPWILFLIVNTLMREDSKKTLGKVPVGDIRLLYRFLMLGIGGF